MGRGSKACPRRLAELDVRMCPNQQDQTFSRSHRHAKLVAPGTNRKLNIARPHPCRTAVSKERPRTHFHSSTVSPSARYLSVTDQGSNG